VAWLRRWRRGGAGGGEGEGDPPEVTVLPIGDELDLHPFRPAEVADVVTEYVTEAHAAGLRHVRVIHGKGRGVLRRTVHAVLERHPAVASYRLGDDTGGSWGATLVELRS
jgi:dsDNA-specific endonuclease/ATPase MutS2